MAKKARVYDGTAWQELASAQTDLTAYSTTAQTTSGFRNAIINGGFDINQRGFTSATTNGTYGFDRWQITAVDGTTTYSSQAFTIGNAIANYEPINFARVVTTGQTLATAQSRLNQRIEDVRTFAGQTVTVSFWARASSGTPSVNISFSQIFGAGGSSAIETNAGRITLSTSFTRYSVTITLPSISGKTIGSNSMLLLALICSNGASVTLGFGLGIQSNTFDFWGVQVEAGSVATPFEQRPIGTELALCQRYYYVVPRTSDVFSDILNGGTVDQSTYARYSVYRPAMRTEFLTLFSSAANTFSNLNSSGNQSGTSISWTNGMLNLNSAGLATNQSTVLRANNNATAYIALSAEF